MIENFKEARFYQIFFYVFVILSIAILINNFNFTSKSNYLAHPQFDYVENYKEILLHIEEYEISQSFHYFFWLDFIWAFCLLLLGHGILTGFQKEKHEPKGYVVNWSYISVAGVAYFMDIIENNIYLGFGSDKDMYVHLPCIMLIKEIFYVITIAWIVYSIITYNEEYQSK